MTLFSIPPSWAWTTLGEIADVVGGVAKDSRKQSDPSLPLVPYLRVANVQRGYLDLSNVSQIRVPESTVEKLRLMSGDVLLNEGGDRDKLGRGWVWQGQIPNCIHQNHVFRARVISDILDPKLLALFTNECGRDWFERHASQTVNLASISLTRIGQLPVPIPPREEQVRILTALDDHLSRLAAAEKGIDLSRRRLARLTRRILVDAVPMLHAPKHWQMVTVADAGKVDLGRQRHPDWHNGPNMRPYLRVANVFENRIDSSDVMEMDFPPHVFEKYRLVPGDILLNEGQSPELLGRPAMYHGHPPEVAFTNSLLRFRAGRDVDPDWALLVFRRHMHAGRFTQEVRITTNIAHLSAGRFKSVEFPIPPLAEQQRIIEETAERLVLVGRTTGPLELVQQRSLRLRRSLLAAAFSGKLVPQFRQDEPASVLLEEMRRERGASPKARRGRRTASKPQEEALL